MIAVIQRVSRASVEVEGHELSKIDLGILTLLGIEKGDTEAQAKKLIDRILTFRIFEDEAGKMNRSLLDIKAQHLIVSQFTLAADCASGRRPSFTSAEKPSTAEPVYQVAVQQSRASGIFTVEGKFQAEMNVKLENLGPATFVLRA